MLLGSASLTINRSGEAGPFDFGPSLDRLHLRVEQGYRLVGLPDALVGFDAVASRNRTRVREFIAATRGRLDHKRRRRRLVVDADLATTPERDRYEVVRREIAHQVPGALAMVPGSATKRKEAKPWSA
jgi:hypothetical protein